MKKLIYILFLLPIFGFGQWDTGLIVSKRQASYIASLAPRYDFNAESLALGSLYSWPNDGLGDATEAVATTTDNRPTVIDEAGNKAVKFDGVDDQLALGQPNDLTSIVPGLSNFTLVIVGGSSTRLGASSLFGDRVGSTGNRTIQISFSNAISFVIQIGTTGQDFANVGESDFIISAIVTGPTADMYNNEVQFRDDSTTPISTGDYVNPWFIGSRADSFYYNGSIRRIIYFDYALTQEQMLNVISEINKVNRL